MQVAEGISYGIAFVAECLLAELASLGVHHGYSLLSCMQIRNLQSSSRPPSSRVFLVGYRKVYSVRGEADVVITSATILTRDVG